MNKFEFAGCYLKNGQLYKFDKHIYDKTLNIITNIVADMIEQRLKYCKVINAYKNPISNPEHQIGFSSLHYLDEVYIE